MTTTIEEYEARIQAMPAGPDRTAARQRLTLAVEGGRCLLPGYDVLTGRIDGMAEMAPVTGTSDEQIAYAEDVRSCRAESVRTRYTAGLGRLARAIRDGKISAGDPRVAEALRQVVEAYNEVASETDARTILDKWA